MILNIEKVELGISAGLQDRVIQTYGGLVHMNFSEPDLESPYTAVDPALLPDMYLAYDAHAGACVHFVISSAFPFVLTYQQLLCIYTKPQVVIRGLYITQCAPAGSSRTQNSCRACGN